jgi:1,4-alpha-glucan branching enzyme
MGGEFAQEGEWNSATALPWDRSHEPLPAGIGRLLTDLNRLQSLHPALAEWDCDARGFEWLSGEDRDQSVISFLRRGGEETLAVILNFTPVPRDDYRIPLAEGGLYREIFNSDSERYGGSSRENRGEIPGEATPWNGREYSLRITLPPLSGVVLQHQA